MALDRAPNALRATQRITDRDGNPTRDAHTVIEEMWRQVVAGFVIVPCVATGTNALALTPRLHKEGGANYGTGMAWSFVAVNTSTGAVTAAVGAQLAKKVYKDAGATQAGSGDLVDDSLYLLVYNAALDGGLGGFVLIGGTDATLIALAALDASVGYLYQTGADAFTKYAAASQSNQETGTNLTNPVTPGVQQFHPSAAKAWAYVTVAAGAPTLQASYNVSGIVDSGVGLLTVTIATDFSTANWASLVTVEEPNGAGVVGQVSTTTAKTAGAVLLNAVVITDGVGSVDPVNWNFVGYGDQ